MPSVREVLWQLREVYRAEQNPQRQEQLRQIYDIALNAALDLADKDITSRTAEYDAAVTGLESGIEELNEARREIADVAKAIKKIAKAADLLAKVAMAVAAA